MPNEDEFERLANQVKKLMQENRAANQAIIDGGDNSCDKKWEEYITTSTDVGLWTLIWMHGYSEDSTIKKRIVQLLLLLTLVAQLIVPIVLLIVSTRSYDEGICPREAPAERQILASAIGAIYFSRVTFFVFKRYHDSDNSPVLDEGEDGGLIQFPIHFDRIMSCMYEPLVYLFNLWIVFTTDEEVEMVLNSLAMEFIMNLDDELKEFYHTIFPPDIEAYKIENNEDGDNPIEKHPLKLFAIIISTPLVIAVLVLTVPAVFSAWIYMSICKV